MKVFTARQSLVIMSIINQSKNISTTLRTYINTHTWLKPSEAIEKDLRVDAEILSCRNHAKENSQYLASYNTKIQQTVETYMNIYTYNKLCVCNEEGSKGVRTGGRRRSMFRSICNIAVISENK